MVVRHAIRTRQERDDLDDFDARRPRIDRVGPDVGDDLRAQPGDPSITVDRQLGVDDLVPGLRRRHEVFAPVPDPADGTPERPGQRADDQLFGIHHALDAEASTDVWRLDLHLVLWQTEQ